jgi:hypothetical protein
MLSSFAIRQKIGGLVGTLHEALDFFLALRRVTEKLRIVLANHAGARSGGRYYVIAILEFVHYLERQGFGRLPVAGVVTGLPAAGLREGHHHLAACAFQQPARCKSDSRAHQINRQVTKSPTPKLFFFTVHPG